MARILVTEPIAEGGLDRLRAAGHTVDVRHGLTPDELLREIVGADALIIRSATQVTAELLGAADRLMVVGRAGIGLDNVDVAAATARGVMVVNAPQSNIISAAEHTMALLLAQARNVPQAHAALRVESLDRFHEPDIAFLYQIGLLQAVAHVTAGDRYDHSQMGHYQLACRRKIVRVAQAAREGSLLLLRQDRKAVHGLDVVVQAAGGRYR